MAIELDLAAARDVITGVHADFIPLNRRFGATCANWRMGPTRADAMALNEHSDWKWGERVLRTLASVNRAFSGLCDRLIACMHRFEGYADRYSSALAKVDTGQRRWVDTPELDSCHTVWIQFHEDLLATLGIERGVDA